jgi:hypothetical protein
MRDSPLTRVLFNPGIRVAVYEIEEIPDVVDFERRRDRALALTEGVVSRAQHVLMVEDADQQALWLVTELGHLAHRSLLHRRLVGRGAGRSIETRILTLAPRGRAEQWLGQFRLQDDQMKLSLPSHR